MKRISLFLFFFCSLFVACTKGDSGQTHVAEEEQYYVKYVADSISGQYTASYEDTKGTITLSNQKEAIFERTVGPVQKGFRASISISCGHYLPPTVRIEVKKGDTPFVVKAEQVGNSYVGASVSYIIE